MSLDLDRLLLVVGDVKKSVDLLASSFQFDEPREQVESVDDEASDLLDSEKYSSATQGRQFEMERLRRQRISNALKGKKKSPRPPVSESFRQKMSEITRESWKDKETRKKRAEGIKRAWEDPESGLNSEETRETRARKLCESMSNPDSLIRLSLSDPEVRKKRAEGIKRAWEDPESGLNSEARSQKISESRRGFFRGQETRGSVGSSGYFYLCNSSEHPIADIDGQVAEHRKVLYDVIGPGTHSCHWGCGKLLEWGGVLGIQVDHLDGDKLNNDCENLVPSCKDCNVKRARLGNPVDWRSDDN